MHRQLREHLRRATGESAFVVAVNIDIRGFSSFFSDSSQAAAYLGSAYTRILDEYFPQHSFFKPTGDGLLIVRNIDRESLEGAVEETLDAVLRLDDRFSEICAEDLLLSFDMPSAVGIGVARGTATRLVDGETILDYSGYPLNLCSRLMDLARPHGVVVHGSFPAGDAAKALLEQMRGERVFIKGLADQAPMSVLVTNDVVVPDANRHPFNAETFFQPEGEVQARTIHARAPRFIHHLGNVLLDRQSVRLLVQFPAVVAGRRSGMLAHWTMDALRVEDGPRGVEAVFDYEDLSRNLTRWGVRRNWPVTLTLSYLTPARAEDD